MTTALELMNKISEIQNKYEKDINSIKIVFKNTIKDKSISLDDRWELFIGSPDVLSEHKGWIVNIPELEKSGLFEYDSGPVYWERRQHFSAEDFVQRYSDSQSDSPKITNELIVAIKEWFLTNNVKSFVCDW